MSTHNVFTSIPIYYTIKIGSSHKYFEAKPLADQVESPLKTLPDRAPLHFPK